MLRYVFLVSIFVSTHSFAQTDFLDPQFGVNITSDIVYATGAVQSPSVGNKDLILDLYEPTGAGVPASKPGFVIIHGGSFTSGNKSAMAGLANEYASRGYVCVSINYRLVSDDPPTPGADPVSRAVAAAVEDAANAVQWMKANAGLYGIDPTRIAIGGYSAGAITALFTGYNELGAASSVDAIVSFAGGLYGFEGSIDSDDPPVIQLHGFDDPTVAFTLAQAIDNAAATAGIAHELHTMLGVGHAAYPNRNSYVLPGGDTPNEKIQAFLYQQLQLASIGSGPYVPNPLAMPLSSIVLALMSLLIVALVALVMTKASFQ